MSTTPSPQQQIDKALKTFASIAAYTLFTKSMSAIYDRQYRRGIRNKW